MSDTLAPDQHSHIQPSLLFAALAQTSIVVRVETIAPDQQACILHLHPTSSQDGNEHRLHADLLQSLFCVDTLHFMSK